MRNRKLVIKRKKPSTRVYSIKVKAAPRIKSTQSSTAKAMLKANKRSEAAAKRDYRMLSKSTRKSLQVAKRTHRMLGHFIKAKKVHFYVKAKLAKRVHISKVKRIHITKTRAYRAQLHSVHAHTHTRHVRGKPTVQQQHQYRRHQTTRNRR